MKTLTILFLLVSYNTFLFAQENKKPEIFVNDSIKIEKLHQECKKIDIQSKEFNPEKIKIYASQALEIADKINYTHGKGVSHYFLGMVNEYEKNLKNAEKHYLKWIKAHELKKSKIPLSVAYIKISNFYFEQNKHTQGKKYFEKAIQHTMKVDDSKEYVSKFFKEQIRIERDKKGKLDAERVLFYNEMYSEYLQKFPTKFLQKAKYEQFLLAFVTLNEQKFLKEKNKKMYDKVMKIRYMSSSFRNYIAYCEWDKIDKNIAFEYAKNAWKTEYYRIANTITIYQYTKTENRKEREKMLDKFEKLATKEKTDGSNDLLRNTYLNYRIWIKDYEKNNDFKNAEYYYEKCLKLVNLFGNPDDIFFWERMMILFYQKYNIDEKAFSLFKKHFENKEKRSRNRFSLSYNFYNNSKNLKHQFDVLNMVYGLAENEKNESEKKEVQKFLSQKWKVIYQRTENKKDIQNYIQKLKLHTVIKDWYLKNIGG